MSVRILTVFGTRPEAIKLAPVIRAAAVRKGELVCRTCVTGQQRQMLDQVLAAFDINIDYDLDVMRHNQPLADLTVHLLEKIDLVIEREQPAWVIVQGDTTTAMVASLAAYYRRVPVAHVEAGLRSGNPWHPFPEEVNRRLADAVASIHFAPTNAARVNLIAEGIPEWRIHVTGNTGIDALLQVAAEPHEFGPAMSSRILPGRQILLVTSHRRENFGEPLRNICSAIRRLAKQYPETIQIIYPVHLNPNVRGPVEGMLSDCSNVLLAEPLGYQDFVHLMKQAVLIITDSGGVQEEAPALGLPVLVIREVTERPEGVAAGAARVVGSQVDAICAAATELLENRVVREQMAQTRAIYGDGRASERIISLLLSYKDLGPDGMGVPPQDFRPLTFMQGMSPQKP